MLSEDLAANQSQQADLTAEITNFQTQLAAQQAQLELVFNTVNASLEQYPYTLQEVNAALGVLSSDGLTTGTTTNTSTSTNTDTTPTSGNSTSS